MRKRIIFLATVLALLGGLYFYLRPTPQLVGLAAVQPLTVHIPDKQPVFKDAVIPKKLKARTSMDQGFALGFANYLCGINYRNQADITKAFENLVTKDLSKSFFQEFFAKDVIGDILARRLVLSFKLSKPIRVVKAGDDLDEFLVEGILTTKSDSPPPSFKVSYQPVAMLVGFVHGPKTEGQISIFEKIPPTDETVRMAEGQDNGKKQN